MSEVKVGEIWVATTRGYWDKVKVLKVTDDSVLQESMDPDLDNEVLVFDMDIKEHLKNYKLDKSSAVQKDLKELLK